MLFRSGEDKRNLAVFWRDGKQVAAEVPPNIAKAMRDLSTQQLGAFTKFMSAFNAPFRAMAVTYNPAFLSVNAMRDAATAFYRAGILPPEIAQGMLEWATHEHTPDSIAYLFREGGGAMSFTGGGYHGKTGLVFQRGSQEYDILGKKFTVPDLIGTKYGTSAHLADIQRDFAGGNLHDTLARLGGVEMTPAQIANFAKWSVNAPERIRQLGEIIEMGPRMVAFRKSLQNAYQAATGIAAPLVSNKAYDTALVEWARKPEKDRKSTRLNSSHVSESRMPSSA